jgi:signal transduction histidine kinase
LTLPFLQVQLPSLNAFIPVVDTVLFLNDLVTSALLYAQFSVVRSRGLLALAMGYLFSAAIIVPHALTFPDAFTPTGLLGAGLQTTVWLYIFWHLSLPPAVIAYALLKQEKPQATLARPSPRSTIIISVGAVVLLACTLAWLVTAGAAVMPAIMVDVMHASDVWHYFAAPPILALSILSIALLWWRKSSILDLWLLIVLWAWLIETILLSTTNYRFSLVWYAGRVYGLLSSSFVLLVLLSESTMLYARLALSVLAQRREREGRMMSMDAMSAAIAHEIKQPLGAMVTNANAGLRWLSAASPNLDRARDTFKDIAEDGHRASEIIQSMRAMFGKADQVATPLDINELVRETIGLLRNEIDTTRILVQLEFDSKVPLVSVRRGQLQQVILNLMTNAIDAMRPVTARGRVLNIASRALPPNNVEVSVRDSGTGIAPEDIERIFEPFFTTKSGGMGMGLAICRSIVEAHGGTLSVSPVGPHGSAFRIVLPSNR